MTENDHVGVKQEGLAIMSKEDKMVAFIGEDGIYCDNIKRLSELDIDLNKTRK